MGVTDISGGVMAGPDETGRPLRLAIVSLYLPSESKIGVGWVAHRLANTLVLLGHDVTVFSPCALPEGAHYRHRLVPVGHPLRTFRWGFAVRDLNLSEFDGLLAMGDDHLVRRGSVPAHVRALMGSCFDEAIHVSGIKERLRMLALGATELCSAVRVPHVVGISLASLRFFPWLSDVIPCGVDTEHFAPRSGVEKEERPTILFVGTYRQRKRGRLLQEAFTDYVVPRMPDAQLWMVCSDAPEAPGVSVLGRITDDELADRYRRAWVFTLPSTYEGFGVPYIEAMASGTAVLATPNRGAREVLDEGRLGVLTDASSLGEALVDLLVDTKRRAEFEMLGLATRNTYDTRHVANEYVRRIRAQLGCP